MSRLTSYRSVLPIFRIIRL